MIGFSSVRTHKTPQRWSVATSLNSTVFRMTALLWSLPVLQHGSLKQQPQLFCFCFSFFFKFPGVLKKRHWKTALRHSTAWGSQLILQWDRSQGCGVWGVHSGLGIQGCLCTYVSHTLETWLTSLYSSRVVHNLKHLAVPHLWNDAD